MNILLIEDNAKMAENIEDVLRHHSYNTTKCLLGKKGLQEALLNEYDMIILDLMLPDIDGIEICKKLRNEKCTTPILMLTARINLDSKVEGLDCGADDYLTKPFLMDELMARVRALIRRNSKNKSSLIQIAENITIDTSAKTILNKNKEIKLSPTEYKILEFLAIHQGTSKTYLEIYESVWGFADSEVALSDSLKVHIAGIRKKLGIDIITNQVGQGYIINN